MVQLANTQLSCDGEGTNHGTCTIKPPLAIKSADPLKPSGGTSSRILTHALEKLFDAFRSPLSRRGGGVQVASVPR